MTQMAGELTQDRFLDGRLEITQTRHGYRAATDPVFLAAATPAKAGTSVLELGCGVGVASLCLAVRVSGLQLTGVELQSENAELARLNARTNILKMEVIQSDLVALPATVRAKSFDHVMFNPPYFVDGAGTAANTRSKETANRENTPLPMWIDVAARRLNPGGWLTLIHLTERLPEILTVLQDRFGDVEVKPLAAREGQPAKRIVLRAKKGGRGAFRLFAPLIIHTGSGHEGDVDSHSAAAKLILRGGECMIF